MWAGGFTAYEDDILLLNPICKFDQAVGIFQEVLAPGGRGSVRELKQEKGK